MEDSRRATIYLNPHLHKALRLKSAESDRSLSDLVNEAVRHSLFEDAIDLEAIEERKKSPERSFEAFITGLRKHGRL